MKDLLVRTISGLAFVLSILFFLWNRWEGVPVLVLLIAIFGSWELGYAMKVPPVYRLIILIQTSLYPFLSVLNKVFHFTLPADVYGFAIICFLAFIAVLIFLFSPSGSQFFLCSLYAVALLGVPLLFAAEFPEVSLFRSFSAMLVFFILIWVNDTMAYIVGRFAGKHRIVPSLSPNKTLEGYIGGITFTIVAAGLIWYFTQTLPLGSLLLFAGLVALFGSIGDLFASKVKRLNDVKDFGKLLPGHGGVLDRFDSFLFVQYLLPVWYILFDSLS